MNPPTPEDEKFAKRVEAGAAALAENEGSPVFQAGHEDPESQRIRDTYRAQSRTVLTATASTDPEGEHRWNDAVDWLLNSRHTGDPDIQDPFWARVDGQITHEELHTLSAEAVRKRTAALERQAARKTKASKSPKTKAPMPSCT